MGMAGRFRVVGALAAMIFATGAVLLPVPAAAHCGGHGESCGPEQDVNAEWCEDGANVYWFGTFVEQFRTIAYWCNTTDPIERVSCNFDKPCVSDAECGDGLCDGSGPNGEGYCNCRDCQFQRECDEDRDCGLGGVCGGGPFGPGHCSCVSAWCPTARCSTVVREEDLLPGQCTLDEETLRSDDDVRCWPSGIEAIVPCAGPTEGGSWGNHGQYVSDLAHLLRDLVKAGLLTEAQMDALMTVGAESACGL